MDLRKRIFILVSVVVGITLAILLFLFVFYNKAEKEPEIEIPEGPEIVYDSQGAVVYDPTGANPTVTTSVVVVPPSDEGAEERFVRHLARTFVERFGSYSNQNDNRHIEEVLLLSSPSMQAWIRSQPVEQSTNYSGMTTQVIESDVVVFQPSKAVVSVGVQQVVQREGQQEERNYRNGRVELIRVGDEWQIDALYWDT